MRFIFCLLFLMSSLGVYGEDSIQNSCTKNLFDLQNWEQIPQSVQTCMNADSRLVSAISKLCDVNRTDLSKTFSRFILYKHKYEDAVKTFEALPQDQQNQVARLRVTEAEEAWMLLGQRDAVTALLEDVFTGYARCTYNK